MYIFVNPKLGSNISFTISGIRTYTFKSLTEARFYFSKLARRPSTCYLLLDTETGEVKGVKTSQKSIRKFERGFFDKNLVYWNKILGLLCICSKETGEVLEEIDIKQL